MMRISRRTALAVLGGAAVVPFATWWEQAAAQGQPVTRASAHSPEGQAALATYRDAVRLMSQKAATDWSGWNVWYKMHKFPDNWDELASHPGQVQTAQAQELDQLFGAGTPERATAANLLGACPHGTVDFWSWHRMYLLFFERLCQKLTNQPRFALPYWDYGDHPTIPAEFRTPVGKNANALWHERWSGYNDPTNPTPLPAEALDFSFLDNPSFFGAQRQSEGSVHGAVHVELGDGPWPTNAGHDMGWVGRSARDPVFWLHHCEIDRLWQGWLARGNSNPNAPAWLDNQGTKPSGYMFFDELTGQAVHVKNRDVLNAALVLGRDGYRYDKLPPAKPVFFAAGRTESRELASANRVAAGARRVDQPLETSPAELESLRGPALFAAGLDRVTVRVGNVQASGARPANIGLYLNLPEGVTGDAARPYLVTVISTFGQAPPGEHAGHESDVGPLIFDATKVVARLVERGQLGSRLVASTLPLAGDPGEQEIRLEGIRVVRETAQ